MDKFVPVILGTGREGNYSQKVANSIFSKLKEKYNSEIITPRDYLENPFTERIGNERTDSQKARKYKEVIAKADGFVVVIPEYNRSFPGELKLLIDSLYSEYKNKKFYLVGVSDGGTGGARAVESFIHVVVGVEGVPVKPRLLFTNVDEVFDENDQIRDEKFKERLNKFVKSVEI